VEPPPDEWDAIALNYTSGTTGNPKGVVYHYRGAYLNAVEQHPRLVDAEAPGVPVDAADVPLQRLVLQLDDAPRRGTNVCLRKVEAKAILDLIREHGSRTTAARRSCTRC
jgi:fatty-acyl-CoA synthase